MWIPDEPQRARLAALASWAETEIPAIWTLDERMDPKRGLETMRIAAGDVDAERYDATITVLQQRFGAEIGQMLAEFFCFPADHGLCAKWHVETIRDFTVQRILYECASRYLEETSSDYGHRLILGRLEYILRNPMEERECIVDFQHSSGFLNPEPNHLEGPLRDLDIGTHRDALLALVRGEWCAPVEGHLLKPNSYQHYFHALRRLVDAAMKRFIADGVFAYEDFARLMALVPQRIKAELMAFDEEVESRHADDPLRPLLRDWTRRLVMDLTQDVEANARMLYAVQSSWSPPQGGRWLERVCELIEEHGFTSKVIRRSYDDLSMGLVYLSSIGSLDDGETEDDLADRLRRFKPKTLWLVLPHAGIGRWAVFRALDADALRPLHELVYQLQDREPYDHTRQAPEDLPNSEDPTSGVVDVESLERATADLPDKLYDSYAKALRGSGYRFSNILTLIDAYRGANRDKLEASVAKGAQIAYKAYGLLPVQGRDDLVQRYLTLKEAHKGAAKFGAERQLNTRAAVQAGLTNLASRAGYRDPARMEWDLEAELGEEAEALLQPRTIEPWDVQVAIDGIKPVLKVSKAGKALKSVPAGLRKTEDYKAIRAAMDQLKEQASRFRRALERIMIDGEVIPAGDLAKLVKIPALRFLLANLVGVDDTDFTGLIDPAARALHDADRSQPIEGGLRLLHVCELFAAKTLSHWQQVIVERRLVQPFKQVFRELYVPTPAELAAEDVSLRFAGHPVRTGVAYRLLQTRGWGSAGVDAPEPCKRFPEQGLDAYWYFPEARYFFTADEELESGEIRFLHGQERVKFDAVPPRIFSEVMRDADLVVSVAQAGDDKPFLSTESSAHRRTVMEGIAAELGLGDMRFADNFAHINGKLARYRVHLGSGNVHIEPANYLCIVPDTAYRRRDNLYLPFADSDAKISEIVSKLLLLRNDDKISDESIREQIHRAIGR